MTTPSQSAPRTGELTGETSQADSGVDVGRPPPLPPDSTHPNHTPSPTTAHTSNETGSRIGADGQKKGKSSNGSGTKVDKRSSKGSGTHVEKKVSKGSSTHVEKKSSKGSGTKIDKKTSKGSGTQVEKKFSFLETMGKMFNSAPDLRKSPKRSGGGIDKTATSHCSPKLLIEAHQNPRGLHAMGANDSFEQFVTSSPVSTPQILQRVNVNTPPGTKGSPINTAELSDSSDRLPSAKSSILKHQPAGSSEGLAITGNNQKKDSHVQFKHEVRKVDIVTDGNRDSEVSESLVSINDSGRLDPRLHSNSSQVVNAMLCALNRKIVDQKSQESTDKPVATTAKVSVEKSVSDNVDSDDSQTKLDHLPPKAQLDVTTTAIEVTQPKTDQRKQCATRSMPNMEARGVLGNDTDKLVTIDVVVDDDSGRESEEVITTSSGHGFTIDAETTIPQLIFTVLLQVRPAMQNANAEIKQAFEDTLEKLDVKSKACKSEANLRVSPVLHKILNTAAGQILKSAAAGNVRQVRHVLNSLMIIATESSELSGYEADGEEDTERSWSMFVQTSDDLSDDTPTTSAPKTTPTGSILWLPGDETKPDAWNRVMAWREVQNVKPESSTDSDLSINVPVEKMQASAKEFPKLLSHNRVLILQEEERQKEVDVFVTPTCQSDSCAVASEDKKCQNSEMEQSLRSNSILKHSGNTDQLKKDSHVQFKNDVTVNVISDRKDDVEIVRINDQAKLDKSPSCDEDLLTQFAQFLSISDIFDGNLSVAQNLAVPQFVVADALFNAFMKQLKKTSSDSLTFKADEENSTFKNRKETVHLDLPDAGNAGNCMSDPEAANLMDRQSTSMPDIRPSSQSATGEMGKSASIEVNLDDAQLDAYLKAQDQHSGETAADITNKLLNRVKGEENRSTDAVIKPELSPPSSLPDRSNTASELFRRIKKAEETPVKSATSSSSSNLSENSFRSQSTGSHDSSAGIWSALSDASSHTPKSQGSSSVDLYDRISATPTSTPTLTPVSSDVAPEKAVSSECEFAVNKNGRQRGPVDFLSDESINSELINWILEEYDIWKETKKRGVTKDATPSNRGARSKNAGKIGTQNEQLQSSSLPCVRSKAQDLTRETKSSGSLASKQALSEIFGQLLLLEGVDTECGDVIDIESLTRVLSDSGLSGEYADDEHSDTNDTIETSSANQSAVPSKESLVDEITALVEVSSHDVTVSPPRPESPPRLESPPRPESPPTALNASLVLSSMKKSLEKLDLQLTAGLPYVDASKVNGSDSNVKLEDKSPRGNTDPVDSFPARDRLLQLIGVLPVHRESTTSTRDSPGQTYRIDDSKSSRPGEKLLALIRSSCVAPEAAESISAHTTVKAESEPDNKVEDTNSVESKEKIDAEVVSDDSGSQASVDSSSNPDRNKLLKLIRSLDRFGLFLPTALGHPSMTDLPPPPLPPLPPLPPPSPLHSPPPLPPTPPPPPRMETEASVSGSVVDEDWVMVDREEVPEVELALSESAEFIIDKAIQQLEEDQCSRVVSQDSLQMSVTIDYSEDVMSNVDSNEGERCCAKTPLSMSHHSAGSPEHKVDSVLQGINDVLTNCARQRGCKSLMRNFRPEQVQKSHLSGASLPSSRVASPLSDNMLGGAKNKPTSSDVRNVIVEKELVESQLRKSQVEISTLQTENKLLKDKYNRSQARIAQLETQLVETSKKVEEQLNLSLDASSILQRSVELGEEDVEGLEKKVRKLTREVDMLRVENASLEKQLDAAHRSHLTNTGSTLSERSSFIEGWRLQVNSLRDELSHVKKLLHEAEESCQSEAERRKEASNQVIKLTELKALLQQQVEEKGGGTVAEKQVKSLETRLRITEERLHNERADRSGKLSEVENKLINENARLQVSEKDVRRQLQRERDRHHNTEQKLRDARAEVDRLHVAMSERPLCIDNMNPTFRQVITPKKVLRDERVIFEERAQRYRDTIDDLTNERDGMQKIYQDKMQGLVKEKHDSLALVKGLEDMNAGLMAENDSVKRSLRLSGGMPAARFAGVNTWEAQNEALKSELKTLSGYLDTAQRNVDRFKAEAASLRSQLESKEQSLQDAMVENERLCHHLSDGDLADRKQHKMDKLMAQITSLEREVERWQNKYNTVVRESNQLEVQVHDLRTRAVNITAHSPVAHESEKLAFEAELREKDQHIYRITVHYNEVENELQRTKQELYRQQQISEQHINELDQLQSELRQKDRMLDQLSHEERVHNAETNALRENLSAVNDELTQRSALMKRQEIDLENNLSQRESVLSKGISDLMSSSPRSRLYADAKLATETLAQAEGSVRLLQFERETMKQDVTRLHSALEGVVHENTELLSKVRHLHQELVSERTLLCQTAADKIELEHQLHICADEKESLVKEKTRLESDLAQLEVKLGESIHKLQLSHTQAAMDYEIRYHTLSAEGKQLAVELGTSKRLLEARESEIELLKDTIGHQKREIEALCSRIELMKEEHAHSREDVDRLTSDITLKMREEVASMETTQQLGSERSKLQLEKYQLEQGKGEIERKNLEISELHQKIDTLNDKLRDLDHQLHVKDTQIVTLEADLKHSSRSGRISADTTVERELIEDVAALNRDMLNLCAVTGASTLGQRLEVTSPRRLSGEFNTRMLLKEEMTTAARQIEIFKREYEDMATALQASKRSVNILKDQISAQEDAMYRLEENKKSQELENDTLRTHLNEHKNVIDQYKKDKQTLYQDVQDQNRRLSEKDDLIQSLQLRGTDMVDSMQKDYLNERNDLIREKHSLEERIARMKDEIEILRSQVKQKEGELEMKLRSAVDVEQEVKARYEAESNVQKAELSLLEAKRSLVALQAENTKLVDGQRKLGEELERAQGSVKTLRDQSRTQRDEYSKQLQELKQTVTVEKHKHDTERSDLQEQLNKAISNARTTEASLSVVTETKDSLFRNTKDYERAVDQLKTQLHEEVTNRKLAEQRIESYKAQIEEIRRNRSGADEQVAELQAKIARTETALQLEKDKNYRIRKDMTETQTSSTTREAQAQALHLQVGELQDEVSSLRNQLETQKQNLGGKNKRLSLEIKQQIETYENERTKLIQQAQQLSVDLEQARENLALKSRDNLKLQEQVLSLEGKLRETSTSLRKSEDSLFLEKQTKDKFDIRNQELEIEVARLKTKMVDSDDPAHLEVTRKEINKMMTELKRKMQLQFESQGVVDKEVRVKELKQLEDLRVKVAQLESALSQEQAMHIVARTQLSSLEDDNQRLRTQLSNMRKRYTHGAAEERTKSKMEEINELIARSQTRAQQMLASGVYGEDPLRTLSPSRDYLSLTLPSLPLYNTHYSGVAGGGVTPIGLLSPAGAVTSAGSGGSAAASDGTNDRSLSPDTKH